MINIKDKKTNCCGCSACIQVCPEKCIIMLEDDEGFRYPEADRDKCINCRKCDEVCPVSRQFSCTENNEEYPVAIGVCHRDDAVRYSSSSGGAFTLLASRILDLGGAVYGCCIDEKMLVRHIRVDNPADLDLLRGSKYVQSNIDDIYSMVKNDIDEGKEVLFTGTPCQAAGLFSFIGENKASNLYIVDFICHGVPSPGVFRDYLENAEKKTGDRIVEYRFRLKDHGWSSSGLQLGTEYRTETGKVIRKYPAYRDAYMNGFLDDAFLRPVCYECPFKEIRKVYSDFTIADFWGVRRVSPKLYDKKGTSLVLIQNEHARKLWNEVRENCVYEEVSADSALKRNRSIDTSARRKKNRELFFPDYRNKGYGYVEKKYMSGLVWGWHRILRSLDRIRQFVKFALVGCSNTIINLAVYYTCIYFGLHYLLAYTLGFAVSVCNAFYWNNRYVFTNKQEKSLLKAFCKVVLSYGFSFALSVLLMGVLVDILNISQLLAPLIKMTVTIPINFVLNKVWAFKDRDQAESRNN